MQVIILILVCSSIEYFLTFAKRIILNNMDTNKAMSKKCAVGWPPLNNSMIAMTVVIIVPMPEITVTKLTTPRGILLKNLFVFSINSLSLCEFV